jgi:hypothetical protein
LQQVMKRFNLNQLNAASTSELQLLKDSVKVETERPLVSNDVDKIWVSIQSFRIDVRYRYQHKVVLQYDKFTIAIEQRVDARAQLAAPIKAVLEKLPSLPSNFTSMNLSEVLPSIAFPVASGPLEAVGNILLGLRSAGHLRRLVIRASPSEAMSIFKNLELHEAESWPFDQDPFISSKIRIFAEIDGQSLLIEVS